MSVPYLYTSDTKLLLQVVKDLERHEGFTEWAYPDPLSPMGKKYRGKDWPWGKVSARTLMARIPRVKESDGMPWTYGYGFTHSVTPDSYIEKIKADRRLESLILDMRCILCQKLPWFSGASFVTQTILINMAFNMGDRGLLKFKNTLLAIKEKRYEDAARGMKLSLWYSQVGSRAKELTERMLTQTIEPRYQARGSING